MQAMRSNDDDDTPDDTEGIVMIYLMMICTITQFAVRLHVG